MFVITWAAVTFTWWSTASFIVASLFLEQNESYFYLPECCSLVVLCYMSDIQMFLQHQLVQNWEHFVSIMKTDSSASALRSQRTVYRHHGKWTVTHSVKEEYCLCIRTYNSVSAYVPPNECWVLTCPVINVFVMPLKSLKLYTVNSTSTFDIVCTVHLNQLYK